MWIDFGVSVYQNGKCDSITKYAYNLNDEQFKKEIWNFMIYKILSCLPLTIFMSFVVISLTNRTFTKIFRNKSSLFKRQKSRDSCFCAICNVNDDHEIIYSKFDLDYVLNLFNRNNEFSENNKNLIQIDLNYVNEKLKYCEIINIKETKIKKILNMIYKSDRNFRFTSRYINSVLVTCVALYYFVVFTGHIYIALCINLHDKFKEIDIFVDSLNKNSTLVTDFFTDEHQITLDIVCEFLPQNLCIDSLTNITFNLPQMPKAAGFINSTISRLSQVNFTDSFEALIIVPIFGAFTICLVQMFLFIRESRLHLQQLYRGQCEFVVKSSSLQNDSIGINDFKLETLTLKFFYYFHFKKQKVVFILEGIYLLSVLNLLNLIIDIYYKFFLDI